jgi:YegS/Rv2252/BmrU family lipid kinase
LAFSLAVIVNPFSGVGRRSGRAAERLRSVSAMLSARGIEPSVCVTEGPGHARELAMQFVAQGVRTVVAWGGDGTVNEVATALAFTDAHLAIVPAGSGNGLARCLGIPLDAARALGVALGPHHTAIDVGEFAGRRFVNVAGVGLDAAIAHRFAAGGVKRRGLRRYAELTLREMWSYRGQTFTVLAHGETIQVRPLLLTLANGTQFGNGAVIARSAKTDDGLLDLVIATSRAPIVAVLQAPGLFLGGAAALPGVTTRLVSDVTITAPEPVRYHVDGEPGVGGTTVRAIVHPRVLRVMVPNPAPAGPRLWARG